MSPRKSSESRDLNFQSAPVQAMTELPKKKKFIVEMVSKAFFYLCLTFFCFLAGMGDSV